MAAVPILVQRSDCALAITSRVLVPFTSIYIQSGWTSVAFPSPSLAVELLPAFKPDRDWFVCLLSPLDWGTKSFSFSSCPNLVSERSLHSNLFATGFVCLSLSNPVGKLTLSVRFPQRSYWALQCFTPVRDRCACYLSVVALGDKIFLFIPVILFGCWAFSAFNPARDCVVCHLSVARLDNYIFHLWLVLPTWLDVIKPLDILWHVC